MTAEQRPDAAARRPSEPTVSAVLASLEAARAISTPPAPPEDSREGAEDEAAPPEERAA